MKNNDFNVFLSFILLLLAILVQAYASITLKDGLMRYITVPRLFLVHLKYADRICSVKENFIHTWKSM